MQLLFGGIGLALSAVSCYQLARLHQLPTSSGLQKPVFRLTTFVAFTFILRAIDPYGYDGVYPKVLDRVLSDSATAALYSISLLIVEFFVETLREIEGRGQSSTQLKVGFALWHCLIWGSFLGFGVAEWTCRDSPNVRVLYQLKYTIALVLLLLGSATAFVYGSQVYLRLLELQTSFHDPATIQAAPSPRLLRILIVMQVFATIASITQALKVAEATDHFLEDYEAWKDCANTFQGQTCTFPQRFPFLNLLQVGGSCLFMWVFRKVSPATTSTDAEFEAHALEEAKPEAM